MNENGDDLTARSDELTARIDAAGGPDAVVQTLIEGLQRQGKFILYTAISVALDIMLSVILFFVVIATNQAQNKSADNAAAIAAVVHTQALSVWTACEKSASNTEKIDSTDRAFVSFLQSLPQSPTAVGQANLAEFEQIYKDAILDIPVCGPEPH